MSLESQYQARLLLVAPTRFPDLRLFRRNIGKARLQGGYTVRFALPGQCDLYGIVRNGTHVEIELKNVGKKVEDESAQEKWASWCAEWGIPYIVLTARKGEVETETVERWCEELGQLLSDLDP